MTTKGRDSRDPTAHGGPGVIARPFLVVGHAGFKRVRTLEQAGELKARLAFEARAREQAEFEAAVELSKREAR